MKPAFLEESLDFLQHGMRALSEPQPDGDTESATPLLVLRLGQPSFAVESCS